jgi:hypothetical protein
MVVFQTTISNHKQEIHNVQHMMYREPHTVDRTCAMHKCSTLYLSLVLFLLLESIL